MQTTVLGWLGQARNSNSPLESESSRDSTTRLESIHPRQPHSIGTFTLRPTARRTFNRTTSAPADNNPRDGYSAKLIAGLKHSLSFNNDKTSLHQTQSQPHPPPSSDFTFSQRDPAPPASGFPPAVNGMAARRERERLDLFLFPDDLSTSQRNRPSRWDVGPQSQPGAPGTVPDRNANPPSGSADPGVNQYFARLLGPPPQLGALSRWDAGPPSQPRAPHTSPDRNVNADPRQSRASEDVPSSPSPPSSRSNPWHSGTLASSFFAPNHPFTLYPTPSAATANQLAIGHRAGFDAIVNDASRVAATTLPPARNPSHLKENVTEPSKTCIICYDPSEAQVIQPCSKCYTYFCISCLQEMLQGALKDMTMMPIQCCSMIQLAVVLPHITQEQADAYRARFEEWISSGRTYCPVPSCSVFIPERFLLPSTRAAPNVWEFVKPHLPGLVKALVDSPDSRYFRDLHSPKRCNVDDFHKLVPKPLFFDSIQRKLPKYTSLQAFMDDLNLIFFNAHRLRKQYRKVGSASDRLEGLFYARLGTLKLALTSAETHRHPNACFACPKCCIGICAECKQIAHPLKPCDTTARDHELAMLATFGYKQCPKCSHAVKKMYGCRHIQCRCGAHWCYHCRRTLDDCDKIGCTPEGDYDSEDEAELEEIEEERRFIEEEQRSRGQLLHEALANRHAAAGSEPTALPSLQGGPLGDEDLIDYSDEEMQVTETDAMRSEAAARLRMRTVLNAARDEPAGAPNLTTHQPVQQIVPVAQEGAATEDMIDYSDKEQQTTTHSRVEGVLAPGGAPITEEDLIDYSDEELPDLEPPVSQARAPERHDTNVPSTEQTWYSPPAPPNRAIALNDAGEAPPYVMGDEDLIDYSDSSDEEPSVPVHADAARSTTVQLARDPGGAAQPGPDQPPSTTAMSAPVDLDAGGRGRWEQGQANFGSEPDDPSRTDAAWSCQHRFRAFEIEAAKAESGYPLQLECNHCFKGGIYVRIVENIKTRKSSSQQARHPKSAEARECEICGLVVCKECQQHFVDEKGAITS